MKQFKKTEEVTCKAMDNQDYLASCDIKTADGIQSVNVTGLNFNMKKHSVNVDANNKTFTLKAIDKKMHCYVDGDEKLFCKQ